MRLMYLILKITLRYCFLVYFKKIKSINSPKLLFGRTIYVSNHPASFMDPLVIAVINRPIVFFMTRSDVFTSFSKPFLWASHMIPIFRQHDGGDTKEQNKNTFKAANSALKSGRNLLIFGEGFTDDVFIRRLKPVKKGAARMGFAALEKFKWKKKIYIAACGNNYTDPSYMRSQLLISFSDRICLNDYKEAYLANPNKVINEITHNIEKMMREQITHVENKDWLEFHEQIMSITRKGMNNFSYDKNLSLEQRWKYSQKLANWLNEKQELTEELSQLKENLSQYFRLTKKLRLSDELIYEKTANGTLSRKTEVLQMILFFLPGILGFIHCAPVYFPIKKFVEKKFRRRVFWGSTKVVMGMIAMGIINIPIIFLFHAYVHQCWLAAFSYYAMIGLFGLSAYLWFNAFKSYKEKGLVNKANTSAIQDKRRVLEEEIKRLISC